MKKIRVAFLISCLFLLSALLLPFNAHAEEEELEHQFRILFLSSYGYSNPVVPEQLAGFQEGIGDINVEIDYEFMDSDHYYKGTDLINFENYIRYKINMKDKFDLIILADDQALRFANNKRNDLFKDIPMVFMGVNNYTEAVNSAAMTGVTGIVEVPDYEANYNMMKKLFPERDRIVAVVDGTISGMGEHVEFLKFKERHPHLETLIINTSYYTPSGLKEAFGELGKNDIILFLDFSIDGKNNLYPLANAAYFIYENTNNVPIFRMSSADIRHGVLGGISYSHNEAGKRAGEMARKILNGENPDDMPLITEGITTAYFDQKIMDEFHIRNKDIPASSIIIDEHANLIKFYRENKVLSNMVIIATLLLITVIVLLFWINVHRYKMIRTDFMTGLPNRMLLMERIKQATDSGTHFGIIMMDVDHFKNINDTLGHQSGDEIIIGVANRLKKIAGPGLTFARLGGDEFAGIFVEPSKEKADDICKKIIRSMKEQFNISTGTLNITVSVGCAMYPVDTKEVEKVMECADLALYEVKERGRDGYALFNDVDKTG